MPVKTRDDLSMVYTPGVARVCRSIHDDPDAAFTLTIRRNTIAIITDGSAVLGLGNIGPRAALPVMEGKAVLFKEFGDVDAFPICLDTQDPRGDYRDMRASWRRRSAASIWKTSPRRAAWRSRKRLTERLEIPVFHDDQHGTAIVVLAALENALKLVHKRLADVRITMSGAGAAGSAIARLLKSVGRERIVLCDRQGALCRGEADLNNPVKHWLAENTNPQRLRGPLSEVIAGSDVFIGVSVAGVLTVDDLKKMASDPIVFALANPDPEIDPDLASPHAAVLATGRSDYANQINNVLCFPGLFRGMLDVRARRVTEAMKIAAARAIAGVIPEGSLRPDYIVPSVFDRRVVQAVAKAVARAAMAEGVSRRSHKPGFHIAP